MRVWVGGISTARPPQGSERIAGNSWLCNIHPEFRYGKPRIDFLLELKRYTLRVNGVGCFSDEPVERSAHSQELTPASRLGLYGGPLQSRSGSSRRGPMRIPIRPLARLWLMQKQQGKRSFLLCCVGMDMWIRGKDKTESSPKRPL